MIGMKKSAKFFCENCGSEVPDNAKVCKKCGKFFISVRCPNCGKCGTSKEFKKGCPECGYAVNKKGFAGSSTVDKVKALNTLLGSAGAGVKSKRYAAHHDSSLPVWIYVLTFAMLAGVMIGVFSCIKNPAY